MLMPLLHRIGLFRRATSGMAAVEFAFLLPVMLTLFFGVVETSAALSCRASVSNVAATMADLVAQESTVSQGDLQNVFAAGNTILYPFYDPSSNLAAKHVRAILTVASVVDDGSGAGDQMSGRVAWVCGQGAPSVAVGATMHFSQPLMTTGGSVIYAEITYVYESPTSQLVAGSIRMNNNFYSKPRRVAQIPSPTGGCPA
jgi:Flp pilus assembly protein TadG